MVCARASLIVRRTALLLLASSLLAAAGLARGPNSGYFDAFEVMDEVRRLEARSYWPGFVPSRIPAGLFDGEKTYLFGFPKIPKGYRPLDGRPDVLVHNGPHRAVFGNALVSLEGVWIAAAVPYRHSDASGRDLTLSDAAGIVIHEKFHVFQALRHPDWKPNDVALIVYPLDDDASLKSRCLEAEALRRAVQAGGGPEAASWARTALDLRSRRQAGLGVDIVRYEREIQRLEGIAEYVEYLASGRPSEDAPLPIRLAPKAVRTTGYIEGRWIATLLDRLDPDWKAGVEAGRIQYLEEHLGRLLQDAPAAAFSADEEARWAQDVREAIAQSGLDRDKLLRKLNLRAGLTLIIEARRAPMKFMMFDPFSVEAAGPGRLVHPRLLALRGDPGAVVAVGMPVLTETDENGRVIRLVVFGLSRRIRGGRGRGGVRYQSDGFSMSLPSARLQQRGSFIYFVALD